MIALKTPLLIENIEKYQKQNILLLENQILDDLLKKKILREIFDMKEIGNLKMFAVSWKQYLSTNMLEVRNLENQIVGILLDKNGVEYLVIDYQENQKHIIEYRISKEQKMEKIRVELDFNHFDRENIIFLSTEESTLSFIEIIANMEKEIQEMITEENVKIYQIKRK